MAYAISVKITIPVNPNATLQFIFSCCSKLRFDWIQQAFEYPEKTQKCRKPTSPCNNAKLFRRGDEISCRSRNSPSPFRTGTSSIIIWSSALDMIKKLKIYLVSWNRHIICELKSLMPPRKTSNVKTRTYRPGAYTYHLRRSKPFTGYNQKC